MNTSIQHPPRPPSTPQEGNLSVSRTSFIPSEEALELKGIVDGIGKRVGSFIEVMESKKLEFILDEVVRFCEESKYDDDLISFGILIRTTGNINEKNQK